jgi:hypothetical protein
VPSESTQERDLSMRKWSALLLVCLALAACRGGDASLGKRGLECAPPPPAWRVGDIDPPNRVLYFRAVVAGGHIVVNGDASSREDLLSRLRAARGLRPSPYLMLESDRSMSCAGVDRLRRAIDQAFSCKSNYCFYSEK